MKNFSGLNKLFSKPYLLYEKFHDKTKLKKVRKRLDRRDWPKQWKETAYKSYPRMNEIILPKPSLSNQTRLKDTFLKRKSIRKFSKDSLSLKALSNILFYGAGEFKIDSTVSRFYPSAGSRYPLEVYVLSLNMKISKGLYHYYIKNHSLEELILFKNFDYKKFFLTGQKWISKAACVILITAIFKRNTDKYGNRGYRQILVEVGHLAQNLYLISSALNIACCSFDGYLDDELKKLLDIDGVDESVIYCLFIGNGK